MKRSDLSLCAFAFCLWLSGVEAGAAPPAHRTKPGVGSAMTVTAMGAYLNRLRPKLTNNWLVPDGRNNVVLTVEVQPDGTVGDVQLSSNPKNSVAEQAAFDSFSKAQPLEALPLNLPVSKLTLTFISNADPHGDSSSNVLTRLDPIATKPPTASPASPQR